MPSLRNPTRQERREAIVKGQHRTCHKKANAGSFYALYNVRRTSSLDVLLYFSLNSNPLLHSESGDCSFSVRCSDITGLAIGWCNILRLLVLAAIRLSYPTSKAISPGRPGGYVSTIDLTVVLRDVVVTAVPTPSLSSIFITAFLGFL
jgi:hypothetical protein